MAFELVACVLVKNGLSGLCGAVSCGVVPLCDFITSSKASLANPSILPSELTRTVCLFP